LQIICLAKIIGKINEANVLFQKQTLEIQSLKNIINQLIKDFAKLLLSFREIPNIKDFKNPEWQKVGEQTDKFQSTSEFMITLSLDLDYKLKGLETYDDENKKKFAQIFQPFLAKIFKELIFYLPFADKLIDALDFVTIDMELPELKEKIITFNEYFDIVSPSQIVELSKEISSLTEENLIVLRKNSQQSSLKLWDLILTLNEREDGSNKYKLLSKIFKFAHSLPISSASVEQSFSTLKWLRNNLRSNLNEQTFQSLIMLQQDFHQMENFISDEMLEKFHQIHKQLIIRKNQNKKTEVTINIPLQDKPPQEEEKTIDVQVNKRKKSTRKLPRKIVKGDEINPSRGGVPNWVFWKFFNVFLSDLNKFYIKKGTKNSL